MPSQLICEKFDSVHLHPRLTWLNPPATWKIDHTRSRLLLEPDAGTDFWQRTHYGFRNDNGHFLYAEISGDATITTTVHVYPVHQYDQAGLMVRFSADCWLKTSTEFDPPGPSQLGTVVTNFGFSDWSLQNFPYGEATSYSLRIRREGMDFHVEHAPTENGPWALMRIAHLHTGTEPVAQMGLYACSPKEAGFQVDARLLRVDAP
jgi:uncharacterized protein